MTYGTSSSSTPPSCPKDDNRLRTWGSLSAPRQGCHRNARNETHETTDALFSCDLQDEHSRVGRIACPCRKRTSLLRCFAWTLSGSKRTCSRLRHVIRASELDEIAEELLENGQLNVGIYTKY